MPEPKVRFLQDDRSSYPVWKTIPMSEVFTEISEKNHPEMPVLSVQQGVGTVLRDSSDRNILYDKANLKNYKAMKKDDFIIHLRSFEGGLECSNYDGISSPAYRILRPQTIMSAAYRDYFRSYEFIHNKLAVSVVGIRDGKNIDMDTFWEIPMAIPCLEEQQKIADFLSLVDEVITASEEEVANLETQKKAVMKKVFSQEVRFKKPDGSDFPEWEEKRLDEVVEFLDGMRKPIETGDRVAGPYPYYGASGITDYVEGYIFDEDLILLSEDGANILDRNYRVCFMARGKYWVNNHAHVLRANTDCVNEYICEYLESLDYSRMNSGSAQPKLNQQTCRKIPVKKPCLEEQRLIANFLSDFDEAIAAAKKELELWKELKKGLLQQMFV